jgi:hypothetical protein
MKGWSGSRSRGRSVPVKPMATARTSLSLAAARARGAFEAPTPNNLGGAGETLSSRPSGRLQYPTGSR